MGWGRGRRRVLVRGSAREGEVLGDGGASGVGIVKGGGQGEGKGLGSI